jgi:hypothetical protein
MALDNPFAGGPDYLASLANALDKVPNAYSQPPASGGSQLSLRANDDRIAVLDEVCSQSGWNRSQVISAMIDKGLFLLFHQLTAGTADKIMTTVAHTRVPTLDVPAASFDLLERFNRFRIWPSPIAMSGKREQAYERTWLLSRTDRKSQLLELSEGMPLGYSLPLYLGVIREVIPDAVADTNEPSFKHAILRLNVRVVFENNKIRLDPVA